VATVRGVLRLDRMALSVTTVSIRGDRVATR
jgi:hypothetical protein